MIAPGARLGRYEVRSKIGEGGMGQVYLAQDPTLDRKQEIASRSGTGGLNRPRTAPRWDSRPR
jgi:hypothetical protein